MANVTVGMFADPATGKMIPIRLIDLVGDGSAYGIAVAAGGAGASSDQVQGNVAHDAADAGYPVKMGAIYLASPTVVQTGDRTDLRAGLTGSLNVSLRQTDGNNGVRYQTTGQDGDTNTIAALCMQNNNMSYNGALWDRDRKPNANARLLSAAASTNPTSVKASAGDLFGVTLNNAAAAKRYLKIFNKASAPTVGTDTPVLTIEIPASAANFKWEPAGGKPFYFPLGIAFALTTGQPDADTGALTAGDILSLNLQYH